MKDAHALQNFIDTRSEEAFAEIVAQYVDLVYTAALRQSRDPHLAEEISQAVFVVLARKAHTIRDAALLPGWLIRATRYAAFNAVKLQSRRRRHEHEAAAMAPVSYTAQESNAPAGEMLAALDEQLARLSDADRTAIALRFSSGMSMKEVGEAMGVSAEAAQKRLSRAIDKLRDLFGRRGIVASVEMIGAALMAQKALAAPAALLPAITAAGGSAAVYGIAKAAIRTMFWTPAKLVAVAAAAAVAIGGGTTLLVQSQPLPVSAAPAVSTAPAAPARPATSPSTAPDTKPVTFRNMMIGLLHPMQNGYSRSLDSDVKRDHDAAVVVYAEAPAPKTAGPIVHSYFQDSFRGKRIRVSAYLKTEDVQDWAGLNVNVLASGERFVAHDDMASRPLHGTNDFTRCESVMDVPQDAQRIIFGASLYGKGVLWTDGFQIEIVGNDVPTTDDHNWHTWCWRANSWTTATDDAVQRNGHATTRIASTADYKYGDWGFHDHGNRQIDQYLGKRIRMTMWIKSEKVGGRSGPHIHVNGPGGKQLANDGQTGKRPVRGTMDWAQYEVFADVPKEAHSIFTGLTMGGSGKFWIDDEQIEIIGDAP